MTSNVGYKRISVNYLNVSSGDSARMKSQAYRFLMVSMLALVSFVTSALSVAASDIANLTTTITDLFTDLIPLIIILGIFGAIMAMVKFRGR